MNKKTLNKILEFGGDIPSAYELIHTIYNDIGFRIPFNVEGTVSPKESFAHTIRNYRKFKLVNPVGKQGKKLSLNGRNILQFLLIQRLLWEGYTLKNMQGIAELPDDELEKIILAKSINVADIPVPQSPTATSTISNLDKNIPWHHFKISPNIMLQIQSEKFPPEKIVEIRSAVKSAIDEVL